VFCVLQNLRHAVLGIPSSDFLDTDSLSVGFEVYFQSCLGRRLLGKVIGVA
jgi:hypothetical protein